MPYTCQPQQPPAGSTVCLPLSATCQPQQPPAPAGPTVCLPLSGDLGAVQEGGHAAPLQAPSASRPNAVKRGLHLPWAWAAGSPAAGRRQQQQWQVEDSALGRVTNTPLSSHGPETAPDHKQRLWPMYPGIQGSAKSCVDSSDPALRALTPETESAYNCTLSDYLEAAAACSMQPDGLAAAQVECGTECGTVQAECDTMQAECGTECGTAHAECGTPQSTTYSVPLPSLAGSMVHSSRTSVPGSSLLRDACHGCVLTQAST